MFDLVLFVSLLKYCYIVSIKMHLWEMRLFYAESSLAAGDLNLIMISWAIRIKFCC